MTAFRDKALAKRMQVGDEEAFREYFDRFFTPLYRFALVRLGGESGDAEEMAQVALCKGISKLDTYRGEARLLTWLSTICRFEILALYKKRSRLPPLHSQESPEIRSALESLATEDDKDPENSLLREELASSVEGILESLPRNYSDALRWKYMDGLSVREIAERSDTSMKAAESNLTRARMAFKDAFSSHSRDLVQS